MASGTHLLSLVIFSTCRSESKAQGVIVTRLLFNFTVVSRLFATPWTAPCQASLSFIVSWSLIKFMSIESVMPSHHLILCCPLLLLLSISPSTKVFASESALRIRWPKDWSFSYIQGWFPLIDWFDLLAVQGTRKSFPAPQFESINSSALSLLYGPTLTSVHDYWKNHSFWLYGLLSTSDVSAF